MTTLPPHLKLCVASDITGPNESIVTHSIAQWRQSSHTYAKVPTIFLLYK